MIRGRFDMTDHTDVERANPVEVLFLMGAAVFKVAEAELPEDRKPDRNLLEKSERDSRKSSGLTPIIKSTA